MTEPSEAAKAKAEELFRAEPRHSMSISQAFTAFARYIQQVSDAAKVVNAALAKSSDANVNWHHINLTPFILPEPVDPLVEALTDAGRFTPNTRYLVPAYANHLREALAKQGYKIVKDET